MVSPKDFREDSSRAIFVTGEIDEKLVHRLTPEICRLRGESSSPITVYINSRGGSTLHAENIRALLKSPAQSGDVCRIITVATNRASSAAADLLALGDYAIAYPAAIVQCHGGRLSAAEITREKAETLATALKETNEEFALRLARRTFSRIAFHFANLRAEFAQMREAAVKNKEPRTMDSDLECFARAIFERVSPRLSELPGLAFAHHEKLLQMTSYVLFETTSDEKGQPWAKTEANLLRKLLDYELKNQNLDQWTLSDGGINDLVADFGSLADYLYGVHHQSLEQQIKALGPLFLEFKAIEEYENLVSSNPAAADKYLQENASPIVEPLWYFVVSLCRLLQQSEHSLTAVDAYWLGIVDEVVGESLPSLRLIAEHPDS